MELPRRIRRLIPREFFLTSGKGVSNVSKLNAYLNALIEAGVAQCNLFPAGYIIPPKCRERRWKKVPVGMITPAVIARADGGGGDTIGAGLAWGWEKNGLYGVVAEASGNMDRKALKETLKRRLESMSKSLGIELVQKRLRIEVMKVPVGYYGSVVVTMVFTI